MLTTSYDDVEHSRRGFSMRRIIRVSKPYDDVFLKRRGVHYEVDQ